MIHSAGIHLTVALVWMFLSGNTSVGGLVVGLLGGFAMMAFFQNALDCRDYIRRVLAAAVFLGKFLLLVAASNLRIARAVLQKNAGALRGEFLTYPIRGLTPLEVLVLCQCIGLTPGTIVADRSPDGEALVLHAFASGTADEIRRSLDEGLKQGILAFTR